jgi:hypothetical protein
MLTILRDFNAGLNEAELRLVMRNLAYFHAASAALARIKGIDLDQHYGQLSKPFDIAGESQCRIYVNHRAGRAGRAGKYKQTEYRQTTRVRQASQ